jgi:hypothetical protein
MVPIDVVIANAGTIGGNASANEISENARQTTLGINLPGSASPPLVQRGVQGDEPTAVTACPPLAAP